MIRLSANSTPDICTVGSQPDLTKSAFLDIPDCLTGSCQSAQKRKVALHIFSGDFTCFGAVKSDKCLLVPDGLIKVDQVMEAVSALMNSMQVPGIAIQLCPPRLCIFQRFGIF